MPAVCGRNLKLSPAPPAATRRKASVSATPKKGERPRSNTVGPLLACEGLLNFSRNDGVQAGWAIRDRPRVQRLRGIARAHDVDLHRHTEKAQLPNQRAAWFIPSRST